MINSVDPPPMSYVLAGTEAGSKLDKAQDLDVPVIDESALFTMLEVR